MHYQSNRRHGKKFEELQDILQQLSRTYGVSLITLTGREKNEVMIDPMVGTAYGPVELKSTVISDAQRKLENPYPFELGKKIEGIDTERNPCKEIDVPPTDFQKKAFILVKRISESPGGLSFWFLGSDPTEDGVHPPYARHYTRELRGIPEGKCDALVGIENLARNEPVEPFEPEWRREWLGEWHSTPTPPFVLDELQAVLNKHEHSTPIETAPKSPGPSLPCDHSQAVFKGLALVCPCGHVGGI